MEISLEGREKSFLHRLASSLVVPRPIGWISTRTAAGATNLAPFSYFNVASTDPLVVAFSAEPREDGSMKDTPTNALETGEFVYNLVTVPLLEQVDLTGVAVAPDENEFELVGLTETPAETVSAPRVGEAKAHFECTLEDSLDMYGNTVVFGRVQHAHVSADLLTDGAVDATLVAAAGRLGGPYYTGVNRLPVERDHDPDL